MEIGRGRVEIGGERVEIGRERSVSKITFRSSQTVYITREKGEEGKVTHKSEGERERKKRVKEKERKKRNREGEKEREDGRRTNDPNVHFRFFDRIQVLIITISVSLP